MVDNQLVNIDKIYTDLEIRDVLDVGSNKGSYNYSGFPKWRVIAIDYHSEPGWVFPENCKFLKTNFYEYVPGKLFDFVICKYTLEHQKGTQEGFKMIQKIQSLLKPGGYAMFVLPIGHCLSNTIYKASFNMRIHNGLADTPDGGHWANYDEQSLEAQFALAGLKVEAHHVGHIDIPCWRVPEGYPYDTFEPCLQYYLKRGLDLTEDEMSYLVRKQEG